MGKHNVTLKKRGGAAAENPKFTHINVSKIIKDVKKLDNTQYITFINSIDTALINKWIIAIIPSDVQSTYINLAKDMPFSLIINCIYIVIHINSYNYELRKLLTLQSNNKNINIEYMLGDINEEITDFTDVIDYKTTITESIFTKYINLLYEYDNLNNYDNIILLYISYTLIMNNNKIIPKSIATSKASDTNPYRKSVFIRDNILNKTLNGESILDIMNTNINTVLQKFHNELIYRFSPYNIINQYLSDTKIDNKYFNDNITILKICILLYSPKYTKLQQQIININKDGNIFTQFKDNATYATIIRDIDTPQTLIKSDIYNKTNIDILRVFIKKIEEYLIKYIYGKEIPIETYKKYFSELYNTLELTIKNIYTPAAPAVKSEAEAEAPASSKMPERPPSINRPAEAPAVGRGKPSFSGRGKGNPLNRPEAEAVAPASSKMQERSPSINRPPGRSLSINRLPESVAPSRPPVRGRGRGKGNMPAN
jgi:hypothetical protein